jgi:hypothetical protein
MPRLPQKTICRVNPPPMALTPLADRDTLYYTAKSASETTCVRIASTELCGDVNGTVVLENASPTSSMSDTSNAERPLVLQPRAPRVRRLSSGPEGRCRPRYGQPLQRCNGDEVVLDGGLQREHEPDRDVDHIVRVLLELAERRRADLRSRSVIGGRLDGVR